MPRASGCLAAGPGLSAVPHTTQTSSGHVTTHLCYPLDPGGVFTRGLISSWIFSPDDQQCHLSIFCSFKFLQNEMSANSRKQGAFQGPPQILCRGFISLLPFESCGPQRPASSAPSSQLSPTPSALAQRGQPSCAPIPQVPSSPPLWVPSLEIRG